MAVSANRAFPRYGNGRAAKRKGPLTVVTFITILTIALGIGLIAGSLVIEGRPGLPPGPIFLSGFYILCLGMLATALSVIVGA
jgi:hypothetical protein